MHVVRLDPTSSLSITRQADSKTDKLIFIWAEGWTNVYTTFISMGFIDLFIVMNFS